MKGFGALVVVVSALGWYLKGHYGASLLEYLGFVTGVMGIYLVAQESIWNWPVGLVNAALSCAFFYFGKFPADAGLQVFFFGLGIHGWYSWARGSEQKGALSITKLSSKKRILVLFAWGVGTLCVFPITRGLDGKWPFWDSFLTAGSVIAQILTNRKKLESWWFWLLLNSFYVPIFLIRQWYLYAILYAIFWGLAVHGLRTWTISFRNLVDAKAEPRSSNGEERGVPS